MLPLIKFFLNMAKGNMLLGYARGSVGDVTFARVKGVQTAHARNRNPNNPKTPSQMFQRAKLAAAVNFFKHCTDGFFKFAFEDKKSNESDYNAFMRHNMRRVVPSPKVYNGKGGLPVTPFLMSQGSLPAFNYDVDNANLDLTSVTLNGQLVAGDIEQPTTVAKLTEILKRFYPGVRDNDILTLIAVYYEPETAVGIYDGMPFLRDDDTNLYVTQVTQEVLDPTDTDVAASAFNFKHSSSEAGDDATWDIPRTPGKNCVGVAYIISRKTPDGLKVTTQELVLADKFAEMYQDCIDGGTDYDTWRDYITASWEASEEAILAGGFNG